MAGASGGEQSFAHAPQMFGDPSTHTITMPSQIREKKAALYEVIELQRSFVRIGAVPRSKMPLVPPLLCNSLRETDLLTVA
jgi:hypothetical protein